MKVTLKHLSLNHVLTLQPIFMKFKIPIVPIKEIFMGYNRSQLNKHRDVILCLFVSQSLLNTTTDFHEIEYTDSNSKEILHGLS